MFQPDRRLANHVLNSFLTIVMLAIMVIVFCSSTIDLACAQEATSGDPLLKRRISDLEAENRALRKIIAEILASVKDVPGTSNAAKPNADGLRIIVLPDDWGNSRIEDMKKVVDSAAHPLASQLNAASSFAPVIIQRSKSGPITLYQRGAGNEYVVRLDSSDRAWAQLAFQFAHEFCHIICNYRNVNNPQMWFEETICEVASLYSLRKMGETWKTNPPYSNWNTYADALTDYARTRIAEQADNSQTLADFYRENSAALEEKGTNRKLNNFIAVKLLPHFEADPTGWQTIQYLNLGNAKENKTLSAYLSAWHQRVPKNQRDFVAQIAREFEIKLVE